MKQPLRLGCFIIVCFGIWSIFPEGAQNQTYRTPASKDVQDRVMEVFGHNQKDLFENPDVLGVVPSPGTGEIWIVTDRPNMVPREVEGVPIIAKPAPPHLPPPPGVIVLKPGGEQEHLPDADQCPPRHKEVRRYRWRFCNPVSNLTNDTSPDGPTDCWGSLQRSSSNIQTSP